MPSLWNDTDRNALLARLNRLTPAHERRWGTMTAPQMLAHLNDAFMLATGELKVPVNRSPLSMSPFKEIVIKWVPFPKGLPIARELVSRQPDDWQSEMRRFHERANDLLARPRDGAWGSHPVFGRLSGKLWGILGYRHTDHHLRQFGL